MKILLLGGYGAVGYETARILLNRTDAEIIIGGRSLGKAKAATVRLSDETQSTHVMAKSVDASDYDDVVSVFKTVDLVIICIPLAACVLQMLDSKAMISKGLHLMGHFLRADRFLGDARSMGMDVAVVREPRTRCAMPSHPVVPSVWVRPLGTEKTDMELLDPSTPGREVLRIGSHAIPGVDLGFGGESSGHDVVSAPRSTKRSLHSRSERTK